MDAAAGSRAAQRRFVARAVNVNVTRMRIHVAATVEAGFQPFQPEDARGDDGVGKPFPGEANRLAVFEHRADGPSTADFFRDPMQAERGAIRSFGLADPEARTGAKMRFLQGDVVRKKARVAGWTGTIERHQMPQALAPNADPEDILSEPRAASFGGEEEFNRQP